MVAVGQIWEYRNNAKTNWRVPNGYMYTREAVSHTRMAWQIVGGEFHGTELHWIAKVIRDEDGVLGSGDHKFSEAVFDNGERFRLIYDPSQDVGVFCEQCGDFYPYASWRTKFK